MSSYLNSPDSDSDKESASITELDEAKKAEITETVQSMKTEGNTFFSQGNFEKALEMYSSAAKLLKEFGLDKDSIILLNRSATYLALKRFVPALNDANQAIEIDPDNWKGHWRKGLALMAMSKRLFRTKQALQAFQDCRRCPTLPSNKVKEVENELFKAQQRLEQQEAESPPPDLSKCAPS